MQFRFEQDLVLGALAASIAQAHRVHCRNRDKHDPHCADKVTDQVLPTRIRTGGSQTKVDRGVLRPGFVAYESSQPQQVGL